MAKFSAVIFDMDGTLIEPLLSFSAIRAELGVAPDEGILESIEAMPAAQAAAARCKLLAHELRAARSAALMPNALETLDKITQAELKTALLTRNAQEAMEIVLGKFSLEFDLAWSRQWGPIKPQPHGVLAACEQLGVLPARTACVGDFRYDIEAANAAGAVSVLLAVGDPPDFADKADHVIDDLSDLIDILEI